MAQAFIAAYNRHNLTEVMDFFTPRSDYSDCDYALGRPINFLRAYPFWPVRRARLKEWLRDRFAEGDRFSQVTVMTGSASPASFSVQAMRTSDILTAWDRAPWPFVGKGLIADGVQNTLSWGATSSYEDCFGPVAGVPGWGKFRVPRGPDQSKTKGLIMAYLDAYNDHNVTRVLQLFVRGIRYYDCDYATGRYHLLDTKPAVARWLRARFREHDHVVHPQILLRGPNAPRVISLGYTRTNDTLQALGLAPYSPGHLPKIVLNQQGDRLWVAGWDGPDCHP